MKKLIYISGIACANLMMFGCMFKVFHWPGASIMLALAVFLFCLFFLPAALINHYQNQETKKFLLLHVVTFVVFFVGMMGMLFKVQHWPGANIFLQISIPLPFILFLPVYLYETRNAKKSDDMNFLGVLFGLTFLAVFTVLLALNVS
jgi:sugar phosphate permease